MRATLLQLAATIIFSFTPFTEARPLVSLSTRNHHQVIRRDVLERSEIQNVSTKHKRANKRCPASDKGEEKVATSPVNAASNPSSGSRLDQIKDMYAYAGFVYSLESCPDKSAATSAFKDMVSAKARTVITFGACAGKDSVSYYSDIITAANDAGIKIIPLVDTLVGGGESISGTVIPRMNNIAKAIIAHPDSVLAVALGDEPMFDDDFGSVSTLSSHISGLRSQFNDAGLDIPISISDMAFGWKQASDADQKKLADNVDLFMVNNFPYFGSNAGFGGDDSAWNSFQSDIKFFEGIANGKPILVTQTGWPSNTQEFAPNSKSVQATAESEHGYWKLLDSHCSDYFKSKNIGWMWRDWDDTILGWGVNDASGKPKFDISAKTTC